MVMMLGFEVEIGVTDVRLLCVRFVVAILLDVDISGICGMGGGGG